MEDSIEVGSEVYELIDIPDKENKSKLARYKVVSTFSHNDKYQAVLVSNNGYEDCYKIVPVERLSTTKPAYDYFGNVINTQDVVFTNAPESSGDGSPWIVISIGDSGYRVRAYSLYNPSNIKDLKPFWLTHRPTLDQYEHMSIILWSKDCPEKDTKSYVIPVHRNYIDDFNNYIKTLSNFIIRYLPYPSDINRAIKQLG